MRTRRLIMAALIGAVGIFYLATLRQGHDWSDDFALYLHHAQNICEGAAYQETGYVYNPRRPLYGPPAYPPLFPLMLVPVYKLFGLSLTAMKVETTLLFMLAL